MKPIYITEPTLVNTDKFEALSSIMFANKYYTNNGYFVQELEKTLSDMFRYDVALVANATLGLMLALKLFTDVNKKKVIASPYSFVATLNAINWAGFEPVFVDIKNNYCIDERCIVEAMDSTVAVILPTNVYGYKWGKLGISIPIICDASHSFSTTMDLESFNWDVLVISLHATKIFSTIEGGLVIAKDRGLIDMIKKMRNFGFEREDSIIIDYGLNAKMSEIHAIFGLSQLDNVSDEIKRREYIFNKYTKAFSKFIISLPLKMDNYSYYPIRCQHRNYLHTVLKGENIYARKYFNPLLSNIATKTSESYLPIAKKYSEEVLCLPIHGGMSEEDIERVIEGVSKNV